MSMNTPRGLAAGVCRSTSRVGLGVFTVLLSVCVDTFAAQDFVPVALRQPACGMSFEEQLEKVRRITPVTAEAFRDVEDQHRNMLADMADQIEAVRSKGGSPAVPAACFKPGTPEETVRLFDAFFDFVHEDDAKFSAGPRWSGTATDGGGLHNGDATTLTVSFPSDGISLLTGVSESNYADGESDTPNNLNAAFNSVFGSPIVWKFHLQQVFDDWSERAGLTYVFDVADDNAPFPFSSGALGSRGDIRIAGHNIDGASGSILAYNYYPNVGDMVLDTSELAFFGSGSSTGFRPLRNTVSHEHGHGLGFRHVCPLNATKIMEPFINLGFDHSSEDDIRHANRKYGDPLEKGGGNNAVAMASDLGVVPAGSATYTNGLSLSTPGDTDYYRFTLEAPASVTVSAAPTGSVYPESGQAPGERGCGALPQTFTNARSIIDLGLILYDATGIAVLGAAVHAPIGMDEVVSGLELAPGDYLIRIYAATFSTVFDTQIQMYRLGIVLAPPAGVDSVSITPGSGYVQEGDALALHAETSGATPVGYQWFRNDTVIPGETAPVLLLPSLRTSDSGAYTVQVSDHTKALLLSDPYVVNVLPAGTLPLTDGAGIFLLVVALAFMGIVAMYRVS